MSQKLSPDSPHLTAVLKEIVADIIDSCILDGIFTMHRAIKLDYFHVIAPEQQPNDADCSDNGSVRSGANSSRDSSKAASCCRCVKCHSKVAATRFAPHLSNCMGLGRNSSRRANKRIAEQQRLEDFDDEADEESTVDSSATSTLLSTSSTPDLLSTGRYTNGNANKHHSPLKLTISLVSVPGKSEAIPKHVVRSVNVLDSTRLLPDSKALSRPNNSTKGGNAAQKSTLSKTIQPEIVLKEARVTLTSHDIHFPGNTTG